MTAYASLKNNPTVANYLNSIKGPSVSPFDSATPQWQKDLNATMGNQAKSPQTNLVSQPQTLKAGDVISSAMPGTKPATLGTAPAQTSDPKTLSLQQDLVKGGYLTQAEMDTGPGIYGPKTTAAVAKRDADLKAKQSQQQSQNQQVQQQNQNQQQVQNQQTVTTPTVDTSRQGLISGLAGAAGSVQPAVNDTTAQINALRQDLATQTGGLLSSPGVGGLRQGQAGVLQNTEAQKESALQGQLSNIIQGASTAGSLYGQGTSLQQPMMQFGMLTNPGNGQIVGGNGATASGVMQSALQNAYNQYKIGTNMNDIMSLTGLGQFGVLGQNALLNMINNGGQSSGTNVGTPNSGGTFNPTTYNTQVGVNQSNLADTQQKAFALQQSLSQIDKIAPVLTNFLKSSDINPFDAQVYNGPVNDYLTKLGNSGAAAQWANMMTDLQNYTSQVISSGYVGTPSGVQAQTLSQDPSKLSYTALQAYLQTLKDLGSNRQSVYQENIGNLGGTGVGYTGNQATPVTSTTVAPAASGEVGTGLKTPLAQLFAGFGLDVGGTALSGIQNAINSNMAAGVAGYVLGL